LQIIVVLSRRIEGHASLNNVTGHMQFKKSDENYYLSDDTGLLLMTGGHQSNHVTEGPAQAKLCCYNGWLIPEICTEEKFTCSANKLPCIDKGINNASHNHKLGTS
jgi:hypothetical protein